MGSKILDADHIIVCIENHPANKIFDIITKEKIAPIVSGKLCRRIKWPPDDRRTAQRWISIKRERNRTGGQHATGLRELALKIRLWRVALKTRPAEILPAPAIYFFPGTLSDIRHHNFARRRMNREAKRIAQTVIINLRFYRIRSVIKRVVAGGCAIWIKTQNFAVIEI